MLCVHPPALQFEGRGTTHTLTRVHEGGKCHQCYFPVSDAVDDGPVSE